MFFKISFELSFLGLLKRRGLEGSAKSLAVLVSAGFLYTPVWYSMRRIFLHRLVNLKILVKISELQICKCSTEHHVPAQT